MGFFKFSSKDKEGNREVRFSYIDGIPNLFTIPKEVVDVTINKKLEKLIIKSALDKNKVAELPLNRIKDARKLTEQQITEANKSVVGRAVVGGLLLGPLGAIIGGMSGVGTKKKKEPEKNFLIITYNFEDTEKQLVFEIVGASIGWQQFLTELPKDSTSIFEVGDGPVQL